MTLAPKANLVIRISADFISPNEHALREYHPIQIVENLLATLADTKVFSHLDADTGFDQIALSLECRLPTALPLDDMCSAVCNFMHT